MSQRSDAPNFGGVTSNRENNDQLLDRFKNLELTGPDLTKTSPDQRRFKYNPNPDNQSKLDKSYVIIRGVQQRDLDLLVKDEAMNNHFKSVIDQFESNMSYEKIKRSNDQAEMQHSDQPPPFRPS